MTDGALSQEKCFLQNSFRETDYYSEIEKTVTRSS